MINRILFFAVLFFAIPCLAQQSQQQKTDVIKDKVVQFFNIQNSDSLYSLAGENFKKILSAEKFKNVCDNNLFPLGIISKTEFEKFDNGVCKYKTTFEWATISMFLGLDEEGKLYTFLFQPYKKEITGEFKRTITDNSLQTELDKKVDAILQQYMFESKTVGLSIGVLQNGKKYFYNYGETLKGSKQLPSSKNLYEIGSVTKTFTGLLLANAVVENKILLNDPVNKYLPKNIPTIKFGNDTLKVMHLSNHSSGLPPLPDNFGATDLINPYKDYDETKLLIYLNNATLSRKPGEKFEYSNLAVGLLGYILEVTYKMPFYKLVAKFITSNTGMSNTKQFLLKTDSSLFVQGYTTDLEIQSQWDFKALAAAGCLRSNVTDMLKYAELNLAPPKNLEAAVYLSHQQTFEAGQQQIALNWFIQNWGWGNLLWHGGQTGGYKSFFSINKSTKNAIIILSNTGIGNDDAGVQLQKYIDQ